MPRVKSKSAIRHRKVKKQAKGFKHSARKRVRTAKEALLHAGQYSYIGRKLRKRDLRSLWITRLNAAAREHGMNYSTMVKKLKDAKILINRKILSDIAIKDPDTFSQIIKKLK